MVEVSRVGPVIGGAAGAVAAVALRLVAAGVHHPLHLGRRAHLWHDHAPGPHVEHPLDHPVLRGRHTDQRGGAHRPRRDQVPLERFQAQGCMFQVRSQEARVAPEDFS